MFGRLTALPAAVRAGMWMTGAMVSFTLMAISGRALADRLDTFEIMTYRSLIGIVIVLVVAKYAGTWRQITTRRMGLHIIRNLFHFAGQNLWFFAVIYVPLSQLFVFEFSTPLWVAAFAPFILAERLTLTRFAAAAIGFIGILVVVRPDFSALPPEIIAAALCAVGFAGATIATKLLVRTETVTCVLFWLVVLQALFGLVMAGYDGAMDIPHGGEWGWVSLIGICGLCAHFCITSALQLAPATVVTPFEFLRLPMVSVVGVWLYNEGLEWQVFVGALVVLWANWLNIRAETKAQLQDQAHKRTEAA